MMGGSTVLAEPAVNDPGLQQVVKLFGGVELLRHRVANTLDAHEMLLDGLPGEALRHLVDGFVVLQKTASLEKAVGMSLRTFQRRRDEPTRPLSQEQSGRTWKFAEILVRATAIFGSQQEAETWLERPAIGLEQRRPLDLLSTPAGLQIVEDFLGRLEYDVYT